MNVYCGMRMENRNVTFPQTRTIIEGVNVPGVSIDDITAILNMRDAWKCLLDSVDDRLDLAYICKLNSFIARNEALEWGVLRYGRIGISGTDYVPPVPVKSKADRRVLLMRMNRKPKQEKPRNCRNTVFLIFKQQIHLPRKSCRS